MHYINLNEQNNNYNQKLNMYVDAHYWEKLIYLFEMVCYSNYQHYSVGKLWYSYLQ